MHVMSSANWQCSGATYTAALCADVHSQLIDNVLVLVFGHVCVSNDYSSGAIILPFANAVFVQHVM